MVRVPLQLVVELRRLLLGPADCAPRELLVRVQDDAELVARVEEDICKIHHFDAKFLVFDTQFLVFDTKFIIVTHQAPRFLRPIHALY